MMWPRPAAEHPGKGRVRECQRRDQVELEGAQGLLNGHGVKLAEWVAAGVVGQQVDAAVFPLDVPYQGLGGAGLGQVGGDEGHVRAFGGQLGSDRLKVGGRSAGQHDMAALAGDLCRDQRPDAAGGTGDQGGAAFA